MAWPCLATIIAWSASSLVRLDAIHSSVPKLNCLIPVPTVPKCCRSAGWPQAVVCFKGALSLSLAHASKSQVLQEFRLTTSCFVLYGCPNTVPTAPFWHTPCTPIWHHTQHLLDAPHIPFLQYPAPLPSPLRWPASASTCLASWHVR